MFCLFILVSFPLPAKTYKIAGKLMEFKVKDDLILFQCESKCDALSFISSPKKIALSQLRKKQPFFNSIGSDVCKLAYKQQSVLGIDMEEDGDGRAFCVFPDQSMVEINSLTKYLTKHRRIN